MRRLGSYVMKRKGRSSLVTFTYILGKSRHRVMIATPLSLTYMPSHIYSHLSTTTIYSNFFTNYHNIKLPGAQEVEPDARH